MFKALTAAALVASSLTVGAAPDRSVTLTTGLMHVPVAADTYLQCTALNASAAPLTVTLEFVNTGGALRRTQTETLQPGHGMFLHASSTEAGSSGYCRASFQGAAASARVSICNYQNNSCLAYLEAR